MNKRLEEAIARVYELPDDRQEAAALLLLAFLENRDPWLELTPEQIAMVDTRMDAQGDNATPEEVEAFFAKFKI
ncbi:MAG TPA: hypothetical protein VI251_10980 [Pseudolabrys sp.]|jgi:hypothetical protein